MDVLTALLQAVQNTAVIVMEVKEQATLQVQAVAVGVQVVLLFHLVVVIVAILVLVMVVSVPIVIEILIFLAVVGIVYLQVHQKNYLAFPTIPIKMAVII